MKVRLVSSSEIASCPAHRMDAEHYIPMHRTWECLHGSKLRTRGDLVRAWLDGKVSDSQFQLAMECMVRWNEK